MKNDKHINKYAHCETYHKGSEGYKELDEMTDIQLQELMIALEEKGYFLSYNLVNDCYTVA